MKIADSPTRQKYPLSRKKIIKKSLAPWILWGVLYFCIAAAFLAIVLGSQNLSSTAKTVIWVLIVVTLILWAVTDYATYMYQKWYFSVYFYDLQDNFTVIRKGPITPREITIPYERFQDVYMDQDLLDRILGLYDVHISSATASSGMAAHIDGLEKAAADGLRAAMLETVNQKLHRHLGESSPAAPTTPAGQ